MSGPQFLKEREWGVSCLRGDKVQPEDLDWDIVFNVCQWEGVSPLIYKTISGEEQSEIPPSFKSNLKAAYLHNLFHNENLLNEIKPLIALFKKEGIPLVFLKGASLLLTLYDDPAERTLSDLDLLIPENTVDQSHRLLLNNSCQLLKMEYWPWWRRFGGSRTYVKDEVFIDLHWNLDGLTFPPSSPDMFKRVRQVDFSGEPACLLRPNEALIYLLYHMVYHHVFIKLIWLYDVLKITTAWKNALDWNQLMEEAKDMNIYPGVCFGLKEVHRLLGASIPEQIIEDSVRYNKRFFFSKGPQAERRQVGNFLKLTQVSGIKNKTLFLLGAVVPSPSFLKLRYQTAGSKTAYLYYLLRPLLFLGKGLKRLFFSAASLFSSSKNFF